MLQTLDITRELYKQIVGIANDAVKQQKKLARKEAVERTQQDIAKVCIFSIVRSIMFLYHQQIKELSSNGQTKSILHDVFLLS